MRLMAIWDFSKRGTLANMRQRAANDAIAAVESYWPVNEPECHPDMPRDFATWAEHLTIQFLAGSMEIPVWALRNDEIGVRERHRIMDAYYESCLEQLAIHVTQRITKHKRLPLLRASTRRTTPRTTNSRRTVPRAPRQDRQQDSQQEGA